MCSIKKSPLKILKSSKGIALFVAILVMTILMLFLGASLFLSRVDTKITSNFKLGTQALEVADAGLQHALSLIQIGYDFDNDLNCGTPPCNILASTTFPSGSDFTYTVSAENNSADINNGGSPTDDTDNLVVLVSTANGPSDSKRRVQAYVKRSSANFTPPSPLYTNASSAEPTVDSSNPAATGFFDQDDSTLIQGSDTNTNDTAGPNVPLLGIATTSDTVTNALRDEYINAYPTGFTGIELHNILGVGSEPSMGTTGDFLNINQIANNFFNHPAAVKYLNGHETDNTTCPTESPCYFGTSSVPQITYIRDTLSTDVTALRGHVSGNGVLVLEGRVTIGGNFRFNGLIVHKRSDSGHYISFEDSALVYGGVLLGSYDENDGDGEKARFGVKDNVKLFYSSEALAIVDSNWGSLLPRPARIFAWVDK